LGEKYLTSVSIQASLILNPILIPKQFPNPIPWSQGLFFKKFGFHLTSDNRLKWNEHIRELRKRILKTIGGLKILRQNLTLKQAVTIVTSQALSILYYASPAWLTPALRKKEMISLESIHYTRH